MAETTLNVVRTGFHRLSDFLARIGIIDADRGRRTIDLAWPRIVTGFARMSQQVVDLAMIGLVAGPTALAGLAFAFAYYQIGNRLSLGLSGGTISLVSQRFGSGDDEGVDNATKQSVWVALVLAVPITAVFWVFPADLIGLLGAEPNAAAFGAVYLRVIGLALVFAFLNKIASRVLIGVDNAIIPMYVRAGGAIANIVFNVVFIFGLGLGVFGAALGTLLATVLVTILFVLGFLGRSLPVVGEFPIHLSLSPPYFCPSLVRELLVISAPLMARWMAHSIVIFPFLAIVSVFGSGVVAAFEVARRLRALMNAPGWGFGLASSSLVGQQLGMDDEEEATNYGWDILRFSMVVYGAASLAVFIFARPIGRVFVSDPEILQQTTVFVRIATISVIWMGIDNTVTGTLRGASDTRWPFYGKFVGLYFVALPVAYLGIVTPLGLIAVYIAFIAEMFVPAVVSFYRFWTGKWIQVSRRYRPHDPE